MSCLARWFFLEGIMTISGRTVGLRGGIALAVLGLGMFDAAWGEESRMLATCLPVSQRTGPVGCWIMAQESLGPMSETPLFWHLSTYPNRAAAEAAKGPGDTVMEALDQVWLFTIGAAGVRAPGGKPVAEIGPLPVRSGIKYTAQYMEAIFPPGAETRPHTHPGPEAWYHAAGGVCLETPEGKAFGRAGDNGFIVPGDRPMRLTVTGKEERRSIVLILHETGKPASSLDTKWTPKGLCRD
jgi:quercetin dioxygenase-like cupin family protein